MASDEPKTIGMCDDAGAMLATLCQSLRVHKDMYGFKLAIAVALVLLKDPQACPQVRGATTKYNIGSLDPDGRLRRSIIVFAPTYSGSIYKLGERLGDWGTRWLFERFGSREATMRDVFRAIETEKGSAT